MSDTLALALLVALGVLLAACIIVLIALSALWLDARLRATRELRRARENRDLNGRDAVECWLETIEWDKLRPTNGSPWHDEQQEGDPA